MGEGSRSRPAWRWAASGGSHTEAPRPDGAGSLKKFKKVRAGGAHTFGPAVYARGPDGCSGRETKGERKVSSIKAGKCRGTHESVQEVRSCYAGQKTAAPAPTFRANRYAGPCARCGATVEPEAGRILPKDGGQNGYDVLHLAGQCSSVPVKRVAGPTARDFSAVGWRILRDDQRERPERLRLGTLKEGRKPGYRFVKRYLGGQGPIRITGAEALRALHTILEEGVDKCGDRFADEHQRCRDCGLPLTDEISRQERRGPVCRSKYPASR